MNIPWERWQEKWNWILEVANNKGWETYPLVIGEPVPSSMISLFEAKKDVRLPEAFKNVLSAHAGDVTFGWQLEDDLPKPFDPIFCGSGGVSSHKKPASIWNFRQLEGLYTNYQGWLADCFSNPDDEYDAHYYHKIPFIQVPNGDFIAFNTEGEVVYLSHDDGDLHGCRLAKDFIEFITRWSNLGCIGTENWQLVVFYDPENKQLMDDTHKIVQAWKKLLTET